MSDEDQIILTCPQCPKVFATRSNLKRHMENPNIHNVPYARSRDQKRWRGHSKKISSRAETTERMRKWRAENRGKNKQNDLRCRVYRLARQKFGEGDSVEKQQFIVDEINRRLGRRMLIEQRNQDKIKTEDPESNQDETADTTTDPVAGSTITAIVTTSTAAIASIPPPNNLGHEEFGELPFYCAPLHKIELPSINMTNRRPSQGSTEPSDYTNKSQPPSPSTSDSAWHEERKIALRAGSENSQWCQEHRFPLPPMQSILPPYLPFPPH